SGGSPNSGATCSTVSAVPSCTATLADLTTRRCEASTPAACHSSPGRSGATTVTSPSLTHAAGPPPTPTASCSGLGDAAGGGGGSPASSADTRRTSSATRPAFHSVHAA